MPRSPGSETLAARSSRPAANRWSRTVWLTRSYGIGTASSLSSGRAGREWQPDWSRPVPKADPSRGSVNASVDLHSTSELLILVTDELDEVVVRHQLLIDAYGERLCIRLGIFNR